MSKFVIDLDTGTIISTKLVVVDTESLPEELAEAIEYGQVTDSRMISIGVEYGSFILMPV